MASGLEHRWSLAPVFVAEVGTSKEHAQRIAGGQEVQDGVFAFAAEGGIVPAREFVAAGEFWHQHVSLYHVHHLGRPSVLFVLWQTQSLPATHVDTESTALHALWRQQ